MAQYLQEFTWYTDKQRAGRGADVANKDTLPFFQLPLYKVSDTGLLDKDF